MENEEMMNVPDEENSAFDGSSYDEPNANVPYDDDGTDSENDRNDSWYEDPNAKASESPKVKRLLDELTDDGSGEEPVPPEADMSGNHTGPSPLSGDASALHPKTAEEEEMELLKHVKSERGRERIKSIISARKEAEMQRIQAQSEMDNFKKLIDLTGLDGRELAQTMEYGMLVNNGDEKSLQKALDLLESQRDMICKKLGREAPGVDLLSDLPELKSAVERRELSMDHALKLAKYERAERMKHQSQPEDDMRIFQSEKLIGSLDGISSSCNNYFRQFEKEADHPAKMQRIYDYFADPDNMNQFLKTVAPPMWFSHVKFLYENMPVPSRKNDYPQQQPLRSRSIATGTVADNPNMSNFDRIMKRMDDMGI
mgnify:FL=1